MKKINEKVFYKLCPSTIREKVSKDKMGVYFLGDFQGEDFCISYVGRSDTCLMRRLLEHAREKVSSFFSFKETGTKESAFRNEALAFYSYSSLRNKIRPASNCKIDTGITSCDSELDKLMKKMKGAN